MLSNYQDIIELFNLDVEVGYILIDNAANMLKAFVKLPGVLEDNRESENVENEDED